MKRLLLWTGIDAWRAEVCEVDLERDRLSASGTQLGTDPLPYRLDYELETGAGWITRRLRAAVVGDGWRRNLELRHDGRGSWTCVADDEGAEDLPPAGGDLAAVAGALDCDLGRCPLTNAMPVLRHELHRRPGATDFLMAWVSVPDLSVHRSEQRYEHVHADEHGAVVRYIGAHRAFVGQLRLDTDGLVIFYPELAQRIADGGVTAAGGSRQ